MITEVVKGHTLFSIPCNIYAGQKFHTVRLGTVTEYVTLALPRLQLRALALAPVNCTAESATLLESLMND